MATERPPPYRLTLLGSWDLRGPEDEKVRSVLSQPKRLCLLAYLALSGEPVARSTLVALFWPERDEERARNALSQSLHYLRRSLTPRAVESVEGDRVRVSPEWMWFDARELLEGRSRGPEVVKLARTVAGGRDFFQGWNADASQPLQQWLDETRRRMRERAETVLATAGREPGEPAAGGRAAERRAARIRRLPRTVWLAGGALVGVVLTVAVLRTGDVPAEAASAPPDDPPEVAVLLPRVTVLDDEPAFSALDLAQAVHDEVVAQLDARGGAEIVSVGFESEVWQLVRSLEAQGSIDPTQGTVTPPDWVVSINIWSGGDQANVIGLLLRGPDYTETGASSAQEYPLAHDANALVGLPRRIAADLVAGLGGAVGTGGG